MSNQGTELLVRTSLTGKLRWAIQKVADGNHGFFEQRELQQEWLISTVDANGVVYDEKTAWRPILEVRND